MASFRSELQTPAQREHYIRTYLGITGSKSSREYNTAYQRLKFLGEGKTQATKDPRYKAVVDVAQFNADAKEAKAQQTPLPTPPEELPMGANEGRESGEYDEYDADEIAEEGDELYAEVLYQISREKGVRRGTVTVSAASAGLPLIDAWESEYWGESPAWEHVSRIQTIVLERT